MGALLLCEVVSHSDTELVEECRVDHNTPFGELVVHNLDERRSFGLELVILRVHLGGAVARASSVGRPSSDGTS